MKRRSWGVLVVVDVEEDCDENYAEEEVREEVMVDMVEIINKYKYNEHNEKYISKKKTFLIKNLNCMEFCSVD